MALKKRGVTPPFFLDYLLFLILACAAASLAIGTLNGEQLTKSRPIMWQNSTELGSPPCSPQIPTKRLDFIPCLFLRPFSSKSQHLFYQNDKGERKYLLFNIVWKYLAFRIISTKPKVVWVKSFVPKEKKSAEFAISSAVKHALGNSIIVPMK